MFLVTGLCVFMIAISVHSGVDSGFKVIALRSNTFPQSVGPADSHCMVEFCSCDETQLLVNVPLQLTNVGKSDPVQIFLHSCEEEKSEGVRSGE